MASLQTHFGDRLMSNIFYEPSAKSKYVICIIMFMWQQIYGHKIYAPIAIIIAQVMIRAPCLHNLVLVE